MFKRSLVSLAIILWNNVALAREEGEVTLPQLETDHYSSQIFWLFLTFAILYFLIAKSALPKIHEVVEKRRHRIERDLEQAERLAAQAKSAKDDYEAIYALALQRSNDLMAKLSMEIEAKSHVENGKLDAQIVQMMHDAELANDRKCEILRDNLQSLSAELVVMISNEIAGRKADNAEINKIIEGIN